MRSEPNRDPRADQLLTPQNCALVIIDYQPTQVTSIRSMDQDVLVDRVVHLARFGMLYRLPVVLSTVNVSTGRNQPPRPAQAVRSGRAASRRRLRILTALGRGGGAMGISCSAMTGSIPGLRASRSAHLDGQRLPVYARRGGVGGRRRRTLSGYVHGGYNRETTILGGQPVLYEDLVNLPTWLLLMLRIEGEDAIRLADVALLSYRHELDILTRPSSASSGLVTAVAGRQRRKASFGLSPGAATARPPGGN